MAEVKRIANKSSINNGTTSADLSLNDKLLAQHTTGDNTDKSISILQAQLTPYGTCATASATATKSVTMVNFPDDFTALVGTKIRVKFTYANTSTSQMYLKVGSLSAKPATCRGVAMGSGSIRAGAEIEFMYDGTNWDCQFSEPISSIDTSSASPVNSSAVNGALNKIEIVEDIWGTEGSEYDVDNFTSTGYKIRYGRFYNNTENYADYHLAYKGWNIIQWVPLTTNATYGYQLSYTPVLRTPEFKRYKSNGVWGEWEKVTTETDLLNVPITYKTNANECIPTISDKKSTFCVLAGGENLPTTSGTAHYIIESVRAKTSSGTEFVMQNAINFDNNTMYIRRAVYNGSSWNFNAWK